MPYSEVKILHDEIARLIAINKKLAQQIVELKSMINKLESQNDQSDITIDDLKTRLGYYENPHLHTRHFLQRAGQKTGPQKKHLHQ